MNNRKQIAVNELVGSKHGEYVTIDEIFSYQGENFQGVTGSYFIPITEQEKERRLDPETPMTRDLFRPVWKQKVEKDNYEKSLTEFVKEQLRYNALDTVFDLSHYETGDKIANIAQKKSQNNNFVFSECVGGGRVFDVEKRLPKSVNIMILRDYYNQVYNHKALELIVEAETGGKWSKIKDLAREITADKVIDQQGVV